MEVAADSSATAEDPRVEGEAAADAEEVEPTKQLPDPSSLGQTLLRRPIARAVT